MKAGFFFLNLLLIAAPLTRAAQPKVTEAKYHYEEIYPKYETKFIFKTKQMDCPKGELPKVVVDDWMKTVKKTSQKSFVVRKGCGPSSQFNGTSLEYKVTNPGPGMMHVSMTLLDGLEIEDQASYPIGRTR